MGTWTDSRTSKKGRSHRRAGSSPVIPREQCSWAYFYSDAFSPAVKQDRLGISVQQTGKMAPAPRGLHVSTTTPIAERSESDSSACEQGALCQLEKSGKVTCSFG